MGTREILETMEFGPAPENTDDAREWLRKSSCRFGHLINGEWIRSDSLETQNPATGEPLAHISVGGAAEVDTAVEAATEALPKWQAIGSNARARHLYALARIMQKRSRLFAVIETMDNGKPIRESRDIDIPLAIRHFYFHAGAAQLMNSELPGRRPVGVCGQIIPWNFPLLMLAWKVAPALAMGNTVVLKPAEYTSLTAMLFADCLFEVGIPPGVVNIVTGGAQTGQIIVEHDGIDKIAFTGSTAVGREIRRRTAGAGKSITLELGGKSAYIVFDDADLDSAVEGLVDAIWFNQGEVCCAGSRLLVQEGVSERFHAKLRRRMEKLRVGDPLDKSIDVGAIVHPAQLQSITQRVSEGLKTGGNLFQPTVGLPAQGCFYPPTLITEVAPASPLMQEEIFGPVLVGTTFRTPEEAADLANNSRYGLAASVWSENINLALDIAPKLVCGSVWVNSTNMFDAAAGFGGRRESGFGREGGWEGLHGYTRPAGSNARRNRNTRAMRTKAQRQDRASDAVHRTYKLYIGGKHVRPDGGHYMAASTLNGEVIGLVGRGNRKDIRNSVEAARKARGWAKATAYTRSQVLYYLAENLSLRTEEFAACIVRHAGSSISAARREVSASVERLFHFAAWADKNDGLVHSVPIRGIAMATNEPVGVIGMICPAFYPLIGAISLAAPAIAMGNTCIVVPSENMPLPAIDLCQVIETSDIPAGVVNVVTGEQNELAKCLASHDDVDSVWYFGSGNPREVEHASAGNLKRTWTARAEDLDWLDPSPAQVREFLYQATEVKNIWIPYGE